MTEQSPSIWNMENYKHLTDSEYSEVIKQEFELNRQRESDTHRIKRNIQEHITETGRAGQYLKLYALIDELMDAKEDLFWRCKRYERAKAKNQSLMNLSFIVHYIKENLEQIKKIERGIDFLRAVLFGEPETVKKIEKDLITHDMIERAKEYPLENLIDASRGFALCPFHDDSKPSLYIKNNFAHCFSCGKTADTIDIYRKQHAVSFPEAVRALQ